MIFKENRSLWLLTGMLFITFLIGFVPRMSESKGAHAWLHITGDNSQIDSGSWELQSDGNSYLCIKKGDPQTAPWIADEGYHSKHSIGIRLDPTTGEGPDHGRDKINFRIVPGSDSRAPGFDGKTYYLGFAVKIDSKNFMPPSSGSLNYLFAQWWQGAPFGPAIALELVPDTNPPEFVFAIRNNETGANPHAKIIDVTPEGKYRSLVPGRWYTFVVATKFGFHDDGKLEAWVNGDKEISWSGSIGYDPSRTPKTFKKGLPNKHLEIYFGPYRDRMQTTQTFYFDQVKYAPDFDGANPE